MSHVKANIFGPIGKDRLVTVGHSTPHQNRYETMPSQKWGRRGFRMGLGHFGPYSMAQTFPNIDMMFYVTFTIVFEARL